MKCPICNSQIESIRSLKFNGALHLYFTWIANQFNEMGWTYEEIDFFTGEIIDCFWTGNLVKEKVWKKLQIELFNKKSTTLINYKEANQIIEILNKYFAERGFHIKFPCMETFLNELDKKNYGYIENIR